MTTKTLHESTMNLINAYLHFGEGNAKVPVPYFNNRRSGVRHGMRGQIGKGTVADINDELTIVALREKVDIKKISDSELTQFLVKSNLGIDCSGFAYHLLNAESVNRCGSSIKKKLAYPYAKNFFVRFLITAFRSVENTGVTTLANDKNSHIIPLPQIQPGDFISMLYTSKETGERNHIVVIEKVEYENDVPTSLYYVHSIAWPSDGEFNHGVREGIIKITDTQKPIHEQRWIENGKTDEENYTQERARKADSTQIRRLNWF